MKPPENSTALVEKAMARALPHLKNIKWLSFHAQYSG